MKIILPVKKLFYQPMPNLKILYVLMVKIKKDSGLIYNKKIKIAPIPVSAILLFFYTFLL